MSRRNTREILSKEKLYVENWLEILYQKRARGTGSPVAVRGGVVRVGVEIEVEVKMGTVSYFCRLSNFVLCN